jgi:hypothetical protein
MAGLSRAAGAVAGIAPPFPAILGGQPCIGGCPSLASHAQKGPHYLRRAVAVCARMTRDSDFKNSELVDKAGQSILRLLDKAADAADQNSRQAVEAAQRLAKQLQAARDRIAQLESNLAVYRDRAERSESWLDKIRTEIEEKFSTVIRKPQR